MAKKKQEIKLESLAGIDFGKEPDIELAQSVIQPPPAEAPPPAVQKTATATAPPKQKKEAAPPPQRPPRSTFAPERKVRATFNIEEDLHKAIKDYSFFEEVNMVEYIFEHLVKPDLAAKGYYPPKKRKR